MANPPVPIEVKRRRGDPGKRGLPDPSTTIALRPADGVPAVPVSLGPAGAELWSRVWGSALWLAPDIDFLAIEELCHLKDQIAEMRAVIEQEGVTLVQPIATPAGVIVGEERVVHPLLKEVHAASKLLQSWGSVLGFNPTARAKLGVAEIKAQSAFEALKERRGGG